MSHVVILERTEQFTITVENADSETEAINIAKQMIIDDADGGGQWSDSLEFTYADSWEE
tara:strand:- start:5990 stop:6166 length:177 start_codon:yes stop_codon:yes gene_type:complete